MPSASFQFPPVETANEHGVVALSEHVTPELLLAAYAQGIFPWPFDDHLVPWVSPPRRAVIDLNEFKIPKSFQREMRKLPFHCRFNDDFPSVIRACADAKRPRQAGTWINGKMVRAYTALFELGRVFCAETLDEADALVGGLYGVRLKRYFAGESMFHLKGGASKFALVKAVEQFRSEGLEWIDVQVLTSHLERFGAKEIPRAEFMERLRGSLALS